MIPQELINEARWCGWRFEDRNGQRTKVPINLRNMQRAKSDDISTFTNYDYVEESLLTGDIDGVGIRVDNGFCAIDIDKCIVNNELSDLATDICEIMQCYTELSPSKKGLRIICKANLPEFDRKKYYIKNPHNGVEIYATGITNRFVTITGNTIRQLPVREATDEIFQVLNKYMLRSAKKLSVDDIIARACKTDSFRKLFEGDMSAHNNDQSSADLALCNMLAFWTSKDAAMMDAIFRKSKLYRDKWEREDYRTATIQKAIDDCENVYQSNVPMSIWNKLDVRYPLNLGEWNLDTQSGIYFYEQKKKDTEPTKVTVCSDPVVPAAYLENRKLNVHRVELHYIHNGEQKTLVCDKEVIYNKNKVLSLANAGLPVNSNTAAMFVRYMAEMEELNKDIIPHYVATSTMGWLGDKFMPYDDTLVFDGEQENHQLYQSITQQGDYDVWLNHIAPLRHQSLPMRLMLAASFASPLIEVCNALPFVLHLWGDSGGGKSVSLMVAMSVWGNPEHGQLFRTMNMTNASMCSTAAFLNNLPFAGDELQTIKRSDMNYDSLIMQITEGIERGRMQYNKNLPTRSWKCAFLFTGEETCVSNTSGGGAKNRVIEVNYEGKLLSNGNEISTVCRENFGHAGIQFINFVAANKQDIKATFQKLTQAILDECDTTDKQAVTGALLLLGDAIASKVIFNDKPLQIKDIKPYLKSESEILTQNRAYDAIVAWIAENRSHFDENSNSYGTWGKYNGKNDSVYIIADRLKKTLQEMNFSFDAVKKKWADDGKLIMYNNKYIKNVSINGVKTYTVEIKLPEEDFEPTDEEVFLPPT